MVLYIAMVPDTIVDWNDRTRKMPKFNIDPSKPTLVFFYSNGCQIMEIWEGISQTFQGKFNLLSVNHRGNSANKGELCRKYNVHTLPSIRLIYGNTIFSLCDCPLTLDNIARFASMFTMD
jgi:hypothetical protein